STSFVVDPPAPALPDTVQPDSATGRFLHFEKILEFVGLTPLVKDYLYALSNKLAEEQKARQDEAISWTIRQRSVRQRVELKDQLNVRLAEMALVASPFGDDQFVGRLLEDPAMGFQLFLGVAQPVLQAGIEFGEA